MAVVQRFIPTPINSANNVAAINQNFDNVATSIQDLLSLSGALPNAMLSNLDMNGYNIINQGNPYTLTSFNWRGNWVTATQYNEGDAVFFNSSSYICVFPNVSGTFINDLIAGYWQNIDLGIKFRGDWSGPGTGYFIGDIVVVSPDSFYSCVVDNVSTNTFSNDLSSGWWTPYGGALGTMATQNANAVNITGGSITGITSITSTAGTITTINSTTANLTNVTSSNATITGGEINAVPIGNFTPSNAKFTTANDSGSAPVSPSQLTNKTYVDGITTTNSNGTCLQLGNGVKFQFGSATLPNSGGSAASVAITFPVAFTNTNYQLTFNTQGNANSGGDKAIPVVLSKSTTGCSLVGDTNGASNINQTVPCGWIAIGT